MLLSLILSIATSAQPFTCEPSDEIQQALKRLEIKNLSPDRRREKQLSVLEELLTQHSSDLFLHMRYLQIARGATEEKRKALIQRYKSLADQHPDDPEYSYLYARALVGPETAQAIDRLKKIVTDQPRYPWPHLELAEIHDRGAFANAAEKRAQVDAFWVLCPASFHDQALHMLGRAATAEMAAKHAPALRERLIKETNPDHLRAWETVWNLEFKAHAPSEHARVRKQVAADLARLEQGPQSKEMGWLSLLKSGHKTLGDEREVRRIEDRILAEYADSWEAIMLRRERWSKEHPAPKQDESEEKKQAYFRAELQMAEESLKKWPNEFYYISKRFDALSSLNDSSPEQVAAAGEALRKALPNNFHISMTPPFEFLIARAFLKKKTHVDQVPALIEEGWKSERGHLGWAPDDQRAKEASTQKELFLKLEAARILVDAAMQLHNPRIAKAAMDALADTKADKLTAFLWVLKAKYAEVEGRKLDALLMYQAAVDALPADSRPKSKDELAENRDRLWKELGGTTAGRELWSRKTKISEASTQSAWTKPTKDLPPWQLADLSGKTWNLASLEGKSVLINVWATWCEPCRMEHPYLEKLYEKIKDRSALQIVTFNIDDQVGAVAPYMKENKYTFPVLLARDYLDDHNLGGGVPKNWIVDERGKWQWEQIGFGIGRGEEWAKSVLEKLEKRN